MRWGKFNEMTILAILSIPLQKINNPEYCPNVRCDI